MQRLVEAINAEYGDENAATYARYVDDIVLLAPSSEDLRRMESMLIGELRKLQLELSKKSEPVPPATPKELFEWLFFGRGIWRSASQFDLAPARIEGIEHIRLRMNFGFIDRPEALMLLHSEAAFDGTFSASDIDLILQAASSAPDLKHRDYVYLARLIWWKLAKDPEFSGLSVTSISSRFKVEWLALGPLADGTALTTDTEAGRLAKVYPTLVWLEGLERLLIQPARGASSTPDSMSFLEEVRTTYKRQVVGGLPDELRGSGGGLEYLFQTRKHNLLRIAREPNSALADSLRVQTQNYLWRFSLSTGDSSLERFQQFQVVEHSEELFALKFFNYLTATLMGLETNGEYNGRDDPLDPWRGRIEELPLVKFSKFYNILQLILPYAIGSTLAVENDLDALNYLLSASPRQEHTWLLSHRLHLLQRYLEKADGNIDKPWVPITPLPGMKTGAILASRCTKSGYLDRFATIDATTRLPDLTTPFDEASYWKGTSLPAVPLHTFAGAASDFDVSDFRLAEEWFIGERSPLRKLLQAARKEPLGRQNRSDGETALELPHSVA